MSGQANELETPPLPPKLQIAANRKAKKYELPEMAARVIWAIVYPAFRYSPRTMFGWRRWILRRFGAKVGKDVHIYASARIYLPWMLTIDDEATIGEFAEIYNLGHVHIKKRATVSQRAHLCAGSHDYMDPTVPLRRLPISIGEDSWVCADAFVGPGVIVGAGAVVGARAVVMSEVQPWCVMFGNPAQFVKMRKIEAERSESEVDL